MPKIAKHKLLTFFLLADEAQHEPSYLRLVKEKGGRQKSAKIRLDTLEGGEQGSQTGIDLKLALKLIKSHRQLLMEAINNVKEGREVTTIKLKLK